MHRQVCTDKSLHGGVFAQSFCTQKTFTHRGAVHTEAFTYRSEAFTQKLLHGKAFTQRSSYTQKLFHSEVFAQKSLYTETLTHRRVYTEES